MQGTLLATLTRFSLFRSGPRAIEIPPAGEPEPPALQPDDRAITRQADMKLIKELGLWGTLMPGGDSPTIRR